MAQNGPSQGADNRRFLGLFQLLLALRVIFGLRHHPQHPAILQILLIGGKVMPLPLYINDRRIIAQINAPRLRAARRESDQRHRHHRAGQVC